MPDPRARAKRKRGRPRLTLPSKKHRASQTETEDERDLEERRPSVEEYATWTSYRSFIVKDEDDEPVTFSMGGYGLIVPETGWTRKPLHLHEYWVGKIREIRSKGADPSEVWAKVQWLWSAKDVAQAQAQTQTQASGGTSKAVDVKPFGKMERFQSQLFDLVHSSCFQDVAHVAHFDESDPEPPLITDETFYVRYSYDHIKKTIQPKVRATCLCGVPYNPDTSSTMHFCPRKKCGKAYHATCLRKHGWVSESESPPTHSAHPAPQSSSPHLQTPPKTPKYQTITGKKGIKGKGKPDLGLPPRAIQLERTLPSSSLRDSRKPLPPDFSPFVDLSSSPGSGLLNNASVSQTPPAPSHKIQKKDHHTTFCRYKLLPPALLALARSPMVRGGVGLGAPGSSRADKGRKNDKDKSDQSIPEGLPEETGCVTGNLAFVTRARRMVEKVVKDGGVLGEGEEWMRVLGVPRSQGEAKDCEGGRKTHGEKDEERRREAEVMRWVVEDEGLLCPSCGGAI